MMMPKSFHNAVKTILLLCAFVSVSSFVSVQALEAGPAKKEISFAYSEWRPIFYIDQDKQLQGLFAEILIELFEKKLGMKLVNRNLPWARCQNSIKTGDADFTIMLPNEDRLQYADKTKKAFYLFYLNVFTYKNHPKLKEIKAITSVQDIKKLGLKPATNIGNGWHKKNIDPYGIKTEFLLKEEQLFRFLAKKRADIVIDFLAPSLYYIRKRNLESEIEVTDARFGPLEMYLMMSKKSKYITLMPEIDNAFKQLKDEGFIDRTIDKYERIQ